LGKNIKLQAWPNETKELAKNKCDELHPVAFTLAKES